MKVLKKLFEMVKPILEDAIKETAKDWLKSAIAFLIKWFFFSVLF